MEDEEIMINESDDSHPVLLIPKNLTMLETNCEATDNVFINLNITSEDTEGNQMTIYSGFCNVKLLDNYVEHNNYPCYEIDNLSESNNVLGEITLPDQNDDNQGDMLIDPTYNPYVSNGYDVMKTEESYEYQSHKETITVRKRNTYQKQNTNYTEVVRYSPLQFEHKKFGRVQMMSDEANPQPDPSLDEELECGLFLSQLPEEIMIATENRAREEMKYVDLPSENDAIKQLMSSDLQTVPKQQRTILYLGDSSNQGQTIQTIAVNDPKVKCIRSGVEADDGGNDPSRKKYQCEKCKQIFYQITAFRQHMQVINPANTLKKTSNDGLIDTGLGFSCIECSKSFKTLEKLEIHCLGHGNPDLECPKCHKVFASKFTLKNHNKIHMRKHKCSHCKKSYQKSKDLESHMGKIHFLFKCDSCDYISSTPELEEHKKEHKVNRVQCSDSEVTLSSDAWPVPGSGEDFSIPYEETKEDHDSVIAQVMRNEMFLLHSKKVKKFKKKSCNICLKGFGRVSDLKRHLIEHVVRSTLGKNPVNQDGALSIKCEVCQAHTFSKVDRYKAHLRDHAKLTKYKCTFCDKSFSDSSNFSKHKKIHGTQLFQCDMCQRKFNSKRTLIQHIQYHNSNAPIQCYYCNREFHFQSLLSRHVRRAHAFVTTRYKCRFCQDFFNNLREKWDHEWEIHNVRKVIVDCLICGSKYRKYSELKRHCKSFHNLEIPPSRGLLKRRRACKRLKKLGGSQFRNISDLSKKRDLF